MKVTVLGSGTSTGVPVMTCPCRVCTSDDPRDRRLRPSVHLEWEGASVLVDTSTDLRRQVLDRGIERIDAVLYTHHHADHILGLDELRLFNWRQGGPVPVFGTRGTLDALARTFWYVFDDVECESTRPAVSANEIRGAFDLLGAHVVPVPVMHGSLEMLGYRVGRFAYLTDVSVLPEASYRLLHDLDVLVLNALRPRPHPTHLSLEQALELAERIGAGRTFLTHLSHEMPHAEISATLPGPVELAYDGLAFDVAER